MQAVLGVYARETGEGMVFSETENEPTPPEPPTALGQGRACAGRQPARQAHRGQISASAAAARRRASIHSIGPSAALSSSASKRTASARQPRLARQQVARRAHDAARLAAVMLAAAPPNLRAAAQPHFGDDQQRAAARDDVEFAQAAAKVARQDVEAGLPQQLRRALLRPRSRGSLPIARHSDSVLAGRTTQGSARIAGAVCGIQPSLASAANLRRCSLRRQRWSRASRLGLAVAHLHPDQIALHASPGIEMQLPAQSGDLHIGRVAPGPDIASISWQAS